jgi:CBS domain-containing protein
MSTMSSLITGSYLMPSLEHATVSDAMHPGILSCDRDAPVGEVARIMATRHVHCVAVMDRSEQTGEFVWGIVSDLDLIRAGLRRGDEVTAGAVARQPRLTLESTTALREAAQRMLEDDTSHVIVVEPRTRRPLGVLSTLDVAGVLAWGEA